VWCLVLSGDGLLDDDVFPSGQGGGLAGDEGAVFGEGTVFSSQW